MELKKLKDIRQETPAFYFVKLKNVFLNLIKYHYNVVLFNNLKLRFYIIKKYVKITYYST